MYRGTYSGNDVETNLDKASPFGRVIARYFATEVGKTLLSDYTEKYGYQQSENQYILPVQRKASLQIEDLSKGGYIYRFAPDFNQDDFSSLVAYVTEHLNQALEGSDFEGQKFEQKPIKYLLSHRYVRYQFRNAFQSQLVSRFKQPVICRLLMENKMFLVEHSFKKCVSADLNWRNLSVQDKIARFHSEFGKYTDILPNAAAMQELDMYVRGRIDLIEVRQYTAVYVIFYSGRVYQISREKPNENFWIFNDYNEYLQTKPADQLERYFQLPVIRATVFFKDGLTNLRHQYGTAKVLIDKEKSPYIGKVEIHPGVTEEQRDSALKSFKKVCNRELPIAQLMSTKNYKNEFKQFIPHFFSPPRDLYL